MSQYPMNRSRVLCEEPFCCVLEQLLARGSKSRHVYLAVVYHPFMLLFMCAVGRCGLLVVCCNQQ